MELVTVRTPCVASKWWNALCHLRVKGGLGTVPQTMNMEAEMHPRPPSVGWVTGAASTGDRLEREQSESVMCENKTKTLYFELPTLGADEAGCFKGKSFNERTNTRF